MYVKLIYSLGARPPAVSTLWLALGHGGAARAGGCDAAGAGPALRPVPMSLSVYQGALAVQTARQVQVLQFCTLGVGM